VRYPAGVAASIRVELARDVDASEVRAVLAEQGFETRPMGAGGDLEVRYAQDETERLANDLAAALEAWIGAKQLPLVPTKGAGVVALRPPGD
jgi:hypothetical protein